MIFKLICCFAQPTNRTGAKGLPAGRLGAKRRRAVHSATSVVTAYACQPKWEFWLPGGRGTGVLTLRACAQIGAWIPALHEFDALRQRDWTPLANHADPNRLTISGDFQGKLGRSEAIAPLMHFAPRAQRSKLCPCGSRRGCCNPSSALFSSLPDLSRRQRQVWPCEHVIVRSRMIPRRSVAFLCRRTL
jgi:hypothetical protein